MKKRKTEMSMKAADLMEKIAQAKQSTAKEMLEAQLQTAMAESFVDLKEKRAVILHNVIMFNKHNEIIEEMSKNIFDQYDITEVELYSISDWLNNHEDLPIASVIETHQNDTLENIPEIESGYIGEDVGKGEYVSQETIDKVLDIQENILIGLGLPPISNPVGEDLQAGEIRIYRDVRIPST